MIDKSGDGSVRRAWRIADEDEGAVRRRLEETLGGLAAWEPEG